MTGKHRIAPITALLLAALLALVACEDTDVSTPLDGVIVLTANPAGVTIDPNAGESQKTVDLRAKAFDLNGFPLQGVVVTFQVAGGELTTPASVKTDADGLAQASMVVRIAGESPVEVVAVSGLIEEILAIPKLVVGQNQRPFASWLGVPLSPQLVRRSVTFDGSLSTDPDGVVTCFQWEIDSTNDAFDERVQGPGASGLQRTYAEEMTLTVTLRVSDNPAFINPDPMTNLPPCDPTAPLIARDRFSPNLDVQLYEITCDNPPPIANAGPDLRVPIQSAQNVFMDGSGSLDRENGIDRYQWNCGSSFPPIPGAQPGTATCRYTGLGVFTATLTVWDKGDGTIGPNGGFNCQKTATDTALVEVYDPNAQ